MEEEAIIEAPITEDTKQETVIPATTTEATPTDSNAVEAAEEPPVDRSMTVMKKADSTPPRVIRTAPHISDDYSMFIDIYDIGYSQFALMDVYKKIATELPTAAADVLSTDITDTVNKVVEGSISAWGNAVKQVKQVLEAQNTLDYLNENRKQLTDSLAKQIDELTKPDLIKSKKIATVQLPMPNAIRDELVHDYSSDSLNLIEKAMNMVSNSAGGIVGEAIQKDIQLSRRKNFTFDPHNIVVYQGTHLREYRFEVLLMPQTPSDVVSIIDGIKMLKKWSSAKNLSEITNDTFLAMSGIFQFRFINTSTNKDILSEIMDIREGDMFYLTSIGVNYTGNTGALHRFEDGTPKKLSVSLVFRERLPQYLNELDKTRLESYKKPADEAKEEDKNAIPENNTMQTGDEITDVQPGLMEGDKIEELTPTPVKSDESIWYGL